MQKRVSWQREKIIKEDEEREKKVRRGEERRGRRNEE